MIVDELLLLAMKWTRAAKIQITSSTDILTNVDVSVYET